jgi:hypothetical protein
MHHIPNSPSMALVPATKIAAGPATGDHPIHQAEAKEMFDEGNI